MKNTMGSAPSELASQPEAQPEAQPEVKLELVLLRHGESEWNKENRFTGWEDVDLSDLGRREAMEAGLVLKKSGIHFDLAYTSVLKRAIRTLWLALDGMDQMWLPVEKKWQLNERHYGALTGLNKAETAAKHGEDQVKIWRRSYDVLPPAMEMGDPRHPLHDPRYQSLAPGDVPSGESLQLTVARVKPLWENEILPLVGAGKKILIVAHGNSLRALVQILENLSNQQIMEENIPTGIPLLYELSLTAPIQGASPGGNGKCRVLGRRYLGDPEVVAAAIAKVKGQGSAKIAPQPG